jgi:NTP pyrophosphatase (non-canonical NTP hydrolase)
MGEEKMLTKEQHILQKISEECVEVSKEISKSILFGLDDAFEGIANKEKTENEIRDLVAVVEMAIELGILNGKEIFNRSEIEHKKDRVKRWLKYSQEKGITES